MKPSIEVERLFTVDGCTVYRFYDNGTRHFASCPGSTVIHQCGKGCLDGVPTIALPR